jgi:hypothetical protein
VRRGASWTAAYHQQVTVAEVARPVRGSVRALGVLAAARPGCRSPGRRLPGGASSRYREVGRRRRGRHCQQASHGVGRRCPACGVHPSGFGRPGSGCPALRCPVTWVVVQRVRHSAVCCPPVQRPVCCPLVRYPAVWCLPPSVRTRPSPPMLRRWRWGPGRGGRATVTPGTGGGPGGCRAIVGSTTVQEAGTRATLPTSRRSVEGRWRTRAAGLVRAAAAALDP